LKRSIISRLITTTLLLTMLAILGGCQNTTPNKQNHGQEEAIPGTGMPNFNDGSS